MSTEPSREIVRRPTEMVEHYAGEFAQVLPSHIKAETFARIAVGALRRDPVLNAAAAKNPASLMSALMEAARLGLEPGTPEFYLTPRGGKNPGVLGIIGYQGHIELIYRAGAVATVKAEVVYDRDDFNYSPSMDRPMHRVDWFSDRGEVRGAYAYAEMVGGGVSKVVVIGPREIERAKAASATAHKDFSPWNTDYPAMVLKTAVRQLEKWVPTSAEYRRELMRAEAASAVVTLPPAPVVVQADVTIDEDGSVVWEESAEPVADADGVIA